MARLPRFLPLVALACVVSIPVMSPPMAQAQSARVPAPAAVDPLRKSVDDFWHYGKIGRYELAVAEGRKVLEANAEPVKVLEVFQSVADEHKDNLDQWMLRWQGVEPMREVTTQLLEILSNGYRARRADTKFIDGNIKRLPLSERAYALALGRLRESGELAVPIMIDYLRDPARRQYHAVVRRALGDMGRSALSPLLAATDMKDNDTLVAIVNVLGDIGGYKASVPFLARLASDAQASPTVRATAAQALIRMGAGDPGKMNPAALFYELAERMYYGTSDISADSRSPVAFVWTWNDASGLEKKDVPTAIYGDVMAMRMAERVLKLDANRADAVSLWLAANYKHEADMPAGAKDPTRSEDQPSPHYFGVAAGTRYLNPVLARALNDHNYAVALRTIWSLQRIIGQSNLFAGSVSDPIVMATRSPDRLVRFEAAMALASAMPQKQFDGRERVVPVLAEALGQTGTPGVLVAVPDQNELNGILAGLKEMGYVTAGGTTSEATVAAAETLPAVDVILISDQLKASEIDRLFVAAGQSPQLQGVAKLVMVQSQASPYAAQSLHNPLLSVTQATALEALKEPLQAARTRAGALPMDEKAATDYAMRAAQLLQMLAITRNPVLDPAVAENALLAALNDARPDLVKAAATALALLNSRPAQSALLTKAVDEKTDEDVKLSLYHNLTTSARSYGNLLSASQVEALEKAVQNEADPDLRAAAAEARGAMNLPADMARNLILGNTKPAAGEPGVTQAR